MEAIAIITAIVVFVLGVAVGIYISSQVNNHISKNIK